MKREILFRGKRDGDGEWVMGDRAGYSDYVMIWDLIDKGVGYLVDPATVGQFTGLCDKDGVKIFEGDVIKISGYSKKGYNTGAMSVTATVTFEHLCWYCGGKSLYNYSTLGEEFSIEVIGNIHDTPDIAKEESE